MSDMFVSRKAEFSPCRVWRYVLEIRWDERPALVFFMLNPSTADEVKNDPTVERCERRARREGYGAVIILNLFAYRATEPADMKATDDPIGPDNDEWILKTLRRVKRDGGALICAWGTHGGFKGRDTDALGLIFGSGIRAKALRLTKHGYPSHPLYLPDSLEARWWSDMELDRIENS